jgi:hypothetical protein
MSEQKNGGPAFGQVVDLKCVRVDPTGACDYEPEACMHGGLTVRDYFAAKALQGMLARGDRAADQEKRMTIAVRAYGYADAMLAARDGGAA